MNCFRLLVLCIALFFAVPVWGQEAGYTLDGKMLFNTGEHIRYRLVFKAVQGKISGYTLSWLEPGKAPGKAFLTGRINKKRHTITFKETSMDNYLDSNMCFLNATMVYQRSGNKFIIGGSFKGTDKNGAACGEGMLSFTHSAEGDTVLGVQSGKQSERAEGVQSNIQSEKEGESAEGSKEESVRITAGDEPRLSWTTDTCIMFVWDYGAEDGDAVTIELNGVTVLNDFVLTHEMKQLSLPLKKGTNKVTITAVNEGSSPPNTARLQLIDGNKRYDYTACNPAGKHVVIVLQR